MTGIAKGLVLIASVALTTGCGDDPTPIDDVLAEAAVAFEAGAPASVQSDSVSFETSLLGAAALARYDSLEAARPEPEAIPEPEPEELTDSEAASERPATPQPVRSRNDPVSEPPAARTPVASPPVPAPDPQPDEDGAADGD